MKKSGIVLEGGGTRGVFTSGVLDYFMEKDLYFPYVIGVSAGACNAVGYTAKQPYRTRKCMIDYLYSDSYISIKNLLLNKGLFDMELIFDTFPNNLIPFDYDTYFNSGVKCIITVTNCETGEAEYLEENEDRKRLMDICKASSSLPFVSPVIEIDGKPYLDGGMADSVPVVKALKDGYKKPVIVLTRNKGYRKKEKEKDSVDISKLFYREYPKLNEAIFKRNARYNKTMDFIDYLEEKEYAFVIRPQIPAIDRAEQNTDVLTDFYHHGYSVASECFDKLKDYLER